MATGFTLWVTIILARSGPGAFERQGTTYGALVALYYAGGVTGGVLIGLAAPLRRWPVGSAVLGVLGLFPLYLGATFLGLPHSQWWTAEHLRAGCFLAIIVGAPVGAWAWLSENQSPVWMAVVQAPTRATVGVVWLATVLLAGGWYLFVSRWTSSWSPETGLLVAAVLFGAPILTALLVTWRFVNQPRS